ncbi:hypothetical protein [Pseudomonas citronellolis]|uniref:hypothetical protein n=1 Tax=Pseudomonas citronellolis TaxID=53408 RepID=UPI00071832DB|nr:hypothetical protein [Pseudomonas citronellolis]KRV72593.1 hypothetical protein AO742_18320 [Pseudomonas citronellolis]KRW77682.1 hypothetical protein AO738_03900 [Pseudomonas citronellolis]
MEQKPKNVWAVINIWTNEVLEEATHLQAAEKIENRMADDWYAQHVGPFWHYVKLPFSICRIDALGRFYPGIKRLAA